jgi:hypothetical protein
VAAGWMTGVRFPGRVEIFHHVQIDYEAHLASYPICIVASFLFHFILPSVPNSTNRPLPFSVSTQNSVYFSYLFEACYMLRPKIHNLLHLLILILFLKGAYYETSHRQFSPVSYHFFPPRPKLALPDFNLLLILS